MKQRRTSMIEKEGIILSFECPEGIKNLIVNKVRILSYIMLSVIQIKNVYFATD